jgi:hypothetical protein
MPAGRGADALVIDTTGMSIDGPSHAVVAPYQCSHLNLQIDPGRIPAARDVLGERQDRHAPAKAAGGLQNEPSVDFERRE